MGINYIGQIGSRRTVWVWRMRETCLYVEWLDIAMSNCPIFVQCCVQLSNDQTVQCTTCPLANEQTVLCPIVQWSDSAVSNCLMVGQCCVQLSNGRTVHKFSLRVHKHTFNTNRVFFFTGPPLIRLCSRPSGKSEKKS